MIRPPRSGNFYFVLGFLFFLLLLIGTATTYGKKAAFFPLIIGIPTILLVILELVRDRSPRLSNIFETNLFKVKSHKEIGKRDAAENKTLLYHETKAIIVILGFFLLLLIAGFLISTPVFVFFYMLIFARESWWKALLLALGTWAFIYLIFCVIMEIEFPWSYLF